MIAVVAAAAAALSPPPDGQGQQLLPNAVWSERRNAFAAYTGNDRPTDETGTTSVWMFRAFHTYPYTILYNWFNIRSVTVRLNIINVYCGDGRPKSPAPTTKHPWTASDTVNRRGPNSVVTEREERRPAFRISPPPAIGAPRALSVPPGKPPENGTVKNNNDDGKNTTESLEGKCIVLLMQRQRRCRCRHII